MARQTGLGFADAIDAEIKKRNLPKNNQIKATQSKQGQKLYQTQNTQAVKPTTTPVVENKPIVPGDGGATPPLVETPPVVTPPVVETPVVDTEAETVTPVVTPVVEAEPEVISEQDLFKQMQDAQRQKLVNQYNAALQQQKDLLQQEETQVGQQYDEMRRKIDVDDVMARKAMENMLIQQGLAGSGARGQSELTQNILTQGAVGQARQDRQNAMQDIARRLQQATLERDMGLAGAEADFVIAGLQNQMDRLRQQEIWDREDTIRAEEQARADQALARQQFIDTMGQYSGDYAAQINTILNDGDPTNDWQADILRSERQGKIDRQAVTAQEEQDRAMATAYDKWNAGFELTPEEQQLIGAPSNRKPRQTSGGGMTQNQIFNNAMDKWERGLQLTPEEQQLIGAPSLINPNPGGGGEAPKEYSIGTVKSALNNFLRDQEQKTGDAFTGEIRDAAVVKYLIDNMDWITEEQEEQILKENNIKFEQAKKIADIYGLIR